jgi:hypothetical protein
VIGRLRPTLVTGCFSTAMLTASVYYGVPIARVGTELLLERIRPYQNSNRIPLTIVDALVPDLERDGSGATVGQDAGERVTHLVRAVGFCMQPKTHPRLRPDAVAWLSAHRESAVPRYFKRRRLTTLDLPGGQAARGRIRRLPGAPTALRAGRKALRVVRAARGAAGRAGAT